MILSPEETTLCNKLLFHLQYYILKKTDKNIMVNSVQEYAKLSIEAKIKFRNELWSDNKWIDKYVEEKPDNLSECELEIIKTWKKKIKDKFFIERTLRKHAIFISSESKVYGILGLSDEIDEVLDESQMPLYVETVLLPFMNRIIYDGLFSKYTISFGKGMREMLRDTYNKAKNNNQIIISI